MGYEKPVLLVLASATSAIYDYWGTRDTDFGNAGKEWLFAEHDAGHARDDNHDVAATSSTSGAYEVDE